MARTIVGASASKVSVQSIHHRPSFRIVPWLLLAILATNTALSAFALDRLGYLPGHDHLFIGRPRPGWEDHAHRPMRHCRHSPTDAQEHGADVPADGVLSLQQMPGWNGIALGCPLCLLCVQTVALPAPALLEHTVDLSPVPLTNPDRPPPEAPPRLPLA